jgi:hypothetical protein
VRAEGHASPTSVVAANLTGVRAELGKRIDPRIGASGLGVIYIHVAPSATAYQDTVETSLLHGQDVTASSRRLTPT